MALTSGTKLGPYEIVSPLGAGGMGEVYRATDTRLGRDVAIKVLPPSLVLDAERLRRFETEARTIAALNHPNILSIHDVGRHEDTPFLVSELLEGRSLREELSAGALTVRSAVEYGKEIAQGLAAAHEKNVVHRDLKPENIFVMRDGRVKILDFGLAKIAQEDSEAELSNAKTLDTGSANTTPGMVLGTVGYMSPEQVRGEVADARSDIFALGAMLYEMVTGQRAFRKGTSAETMTAILNEEPAELTSSSGMIPAGLDRVVRRCLEKKPLQRFQSARDLAFNLEGLSGTGTGSGVVTPLQNAKPVRKIWQWAVAAMGLAALLLGSWMAAKRSAAKPVLNFKRLTYQQGYVTNARFAKDGQTVVYSAQLENEPLSVYTVRVEFPQSTKVDLPSSTLLALSPTGDLQILVDPEYHSNFINGTLGQTTMAGGMPRVQMKDAIAADYGPDGKALVLIRSANQKIQLEYPQGKVMYTTSGYLDYVRLSPDGKQVAFLEHPVYDDDRGWVSILDEAGNHKQLTPEYSTVQGLAWSPSGKEVWFTANSETTDRQLYGVTLDGTAREILKTPSGIRLQDIAADGRVLLSSEGFRQEVRGIDPATGKERKGLEWFNGSLMNDISPDGKAILIHEWGGPAGPLYLVVYRKMDGSAPTALGEGGSPRFSPDGTMAAAVLVSRPPKVALHPIGMGESKRLDVGEIVSLDSVEWFPDGKHLLITGATAGQALRTYQMDIVGGKPQPVGPSNFYGLGVAKDGKRIVGKLASGDAQVLDLDTQKLQPIKGIGREDSIDKWTDDGRNLLVARSTPRGGEIYRIDIASGKRTLLQKVALSETAGSNINIKMFYAEHSKTYAYDVRRVLCDLYVVTGLE